MILTRGPLRDWWMPLVREVLPNRGTASTQGYYILGGDGQAYLWDNYPPRLSQFLDRGLAAFRQNRPERVEIGDELVRAAAPQAPPDGTSVLRLFTRIRPLPEGANPMNALLGRDYMWVLRDEVQAILAASERANSFAMPRTFVGRLVTFHLVDNVRGQVWPWRPQDISRASFIARTVRTEGKVRTFAFNGSFAKRSSNPPAWQDRGLEGTVEGEFDVDMATARIVRFRAHAGSQSWSDARHERNFPPPSGRYPLVTAMVEANDDLAKHVAPEQAITGQHYLRPFMPLR